MIARSILTLFTALLLGATLSVPMVVATGESGGAAASFLAAPADVVLPCQPVDTEADDGLALLEPSPVSAFNHSSATVLPLEPAATRSSERPPARASPTCL